MALDVAALRNDTPGCRNVLHFNNAGASLMPRPVLSAVQAHLSLEADIGGYEANAAQKDACQDTYRALEELLGAHTGEIALLENATRAWDQIFYGMRFERGDRVITAQVSYASNFIAMLQREKQTGIKIDVIRNDEHGQVDVSALERSITSKTRLICLTHIPTNGGLINPASEVGRIAQKHGVPYLLDACQSVGQIRIDVDEIGCDFLSGTGRKYLRGPRGTGFLYVRASSIDMIEPPFLDLHAATWTGVRQYRMRDDASRFENWEGYVAGKIGLGVAVRYLLGVGPAETYTRIGQIAESLRIQLESIEGITVHDQGLRKGGIVTFSSSRVDSDHLFSALRAQNINVTLSVPEWARLDAEWRDLPVMIRASLHYYNTELEIARFCEMIKVSGAA